VVVAVVVRVVVPAVGVRVDGLVGFPRVTELGAFHGISVVVVVVMVVMMMVVVVMVTAV
jgi:hypothetical protein